MSTQLPSVDHPPGHTVGPPQQATRPWQTRPFPAPRECGYCSPARPRVIGGRGPGSVAVALALLLDELEIALAIVAKAKIISQHHVPHPRPATKISSTNCWADMLANCSLKRMRNTRSTPSSRSARHFSQKAHNARRRLQRCKILPRQWLEHNHHRGQRQLPALSSRWPITAW